MALSCKLWSLQLGVLLSTVIAHVTGKQTRNSALFEDGSMWGGGGSGGRPSLKNVHRCRATTGGEFWPRSALISRNKGSGTRPRQSPHQERDCRSRNIHQFFSPTFSTTTFESYLLRPRQVPSSRSCRPEISLPEYNKIQYRQVGGVQRDQLASKNKTGSCCCSGAA